MNRFLTLSLILILSTACLALRKKRALQAGTHAEHLEQRRLAEQRQGNIVVTDEHIKRRLASVTSPNRWRRMKIWFDLTQLKKQNPSYANFYQKVFDLTGKWWESAVWIKDDKGDLPQVLEKT